MNILGISAFYHDSAACLVQDGKIIAAVQEERFTRKKHDFKFPKLGIEYCLKQGKISVDDLDYVVFYDKPLLKFDRILQTYLSTAPKGFNSYLQAIPLWLKEKLWIPNTIKNELNYKGKVLFTEHHQSHAASAFYPSPYSNSAILTIDGVGEWTTNSIGVGNGNNLELIKDIKFPHSIGLLYSAFTYYTGFKVNSGEYKVMGLAPYGEPKFVDLIYDNLIDLKEDGSYRLNMDYLSYMSGLRMTNHKFDDLFGAPRRSPESEISQREMDLAKSIQVVVEDVMIKQANYVHKLTGSKNLCMAGGVALNCVGNGKLLKNSPFENIWIQPASGDAGGALGAALTCWYGYLSNERVVDEKSDLQSFSFLGPEYGDQEVVESLKEFNPVYTNYSENEFYDQASDILASENVVGWFQDKMEFGPRALGNRSIIGDPRSKEMQSKMNLKIKYRESFRPFAPIVLRSKVSEYFDIDVDSPYMLLVAPIQESRRVKLNEDQSKLFGIDKLKTIRSDIPAVTHVDYSARVQTVDQEQNKKFGKLLESFYKKTKCPVLVNTSFNVRGEPIVCTPKDAYVCFMRTEMDYLIINNLIFKKEDQPKFNKDSDWQNEFELD